jgi:hypothetical protein
MENPPLVRREERFQFFGFIGISRARKSFYLLLGFMGRGWNSRKA